MPEPLPQPKPEYRFENDVSGRLFCWLIEAGKVDWRALMDEALREDAKGQEVIPRFAKALKQAVGEREEKGDRVPSGCHLPRPTCGRCPPATNVPSVPGCAQMGTVPFFRPQGPAPGPRPVAPAYSIWFRPSPSKKVKFKKVAEALLAFAGWRFPQE
jgi:hypothetical protein